MNSFMPSILKSETHCSFPQSQVSDSIRYSQVRALLPSDSQHLWRLEEGLVRTYSWNEQGDITILGIWGPGDIVGQSLSNVTPYRIQSLGTVKVQPVNLKHWLTAEVILEYAQQLTLLLKIVSIRRADDRLLSLLKWLAERFGRVTPTGIFTALPITHQELAETANITRVTATRLIGELEQRGILKWSRCQHFELLNS